MSAIRKIEINFPVEIELPSGFDYILDGLLQMVCADYEDKHHTRVMWVSGGGYKPILNEPNEPDFDRSIYCLDVREREDVTGQNRNNPNREQLRKAYLKKCEQRRNKA